MNWFHLILWILVGIGALLLDIATSAFLFVWFTAGAIGAIIVMTAGASFATQLIVFAVLSALFMGTGYPLVKKNLKKTVKRTKTMEEEYIGRELLSEQEIVRKGTIKLGGIYWTVDNEGETINRGDKFKIVGISGNKLLVKKVELS